MDREEALKFFRNEIEEIEAEKTTPQEWMDDFKGAFAALSSPCACGKAFEYAEWALEQALAIKMGVTGEESTRAQGQADALRVVLSYFREAKAALPEVPS